MKIRKKLTLEFIGMAILISIIMSFFMLKCNMAIDESINKITTINIDELEASMGIAYHIQKVKSNIKEIFLESLGGNNPNEIKHANNAIRQSIVKLQEYLLSWENAINLKFTIEKEKQLALYTARTDNEKKKQIEFKRLYDQLKKSNIKIEQANQHAIFMLAIASEYNDTHTGDHIKRITSLTAELALELGIEASLSKQMGLDSILHDLGKIGIPNNILLKPGKLSDNEFTTMKQHTLIVAKIIGDDEWFHQACQTARSHHEKWDGSGYPEGLKGADIPLAARIVTVVDKFDALISIRPYKNSWPLKKAINEIKLESGIHLDPEIVEAFLSIYKKGKLEKYLDSPSLVNL